MSRKEDRMSKKVSYESVLGPYMEELLRMKRAQGMDSTTLSWIFNDLDKYVLSEGLKDTFVTETWYNQWKESQNNICERTLYHKCSAWRQLLSYMSKRGCHCFIPRLPRRPRSSFVPYIFSKKQIEALFMAIDNQKYLSNDKRNGLFSMPALLRLLYSTGLRVSEALALKNKDVDMSIGIIKIRDSKNNSERMVALCESMKKVLLDYLEYRNSLSLKDLTDPERPLFIRLDGDSLTKTTVYRFFYRSCEDAGIELQGRSIGPTVHSLRHTSATHALAKMSDEGIDIYTALPILSSSLGHMKPSSTEYYVRLTLSMFPDIEDRVSSINEFVFPKTSRL